MNQGVLLCKLDDLPDNSSRGFLPDARGQDTVFIVRRGSKLYGYSDICPHYGDTALPWKKDVYLDAGGDYIVCAAHGALFTPDTGECVKGPCRGDFLTPLNITVTAEQDVVLLCESRGKEQ